MIKGKGKKNQMISWLRAGISSHSVYKCKLIYGSDGVTLTGLSVKLNVISKDSV